jgi:hypothetical protein
MICQGCHQEAYQVHGWYDVKFGYQEICDKCGEVSSSDAPVHDVFWNGRPYYSESLDCEFTSRSQKARVMKEKGVTELGSEKLGNKSWTEGSREYRRKQFEKDRPMIRELQKQYRERKR